MECAMCEVRSAIGTCVRCQCLLCEVCGKTCERCGDIVCSEHVHITRHGHVLCLECYAERQARHPGPEPVSVGAHGGRVHETPRHGGGAAIAHGAEPEPEVAEEALAVSARTAIPPWKLALLIASVGLVVMGVLLVFPSFRRVNLSSSAYLPTPYFLIVIPLIAAIWGSVGVAQSTELRAQLYSIVAVAIAALTMGLAVFEVYTDPARLVELEGRQNESVRATMDEKQLQQWRTEKLRRNPQSSGATASDVPR